MSKPPIEYFVFDIESVADGDLVSKLRYPEDDLSGEEAIARYREELLEKYDSDFIPYTFQVPVSVVIGKVSADFNLVDVVALDEPEFRPHIITENFWRGWKGYGQPTLVTFNGRTFDVPLLELACFRFGIGVPEWFNLKSRSYEQNRNRYNIDAHLDLQDILTNFGASRFNGGLNLAANLIGKPGKMKIQGHMVQDLYNEGRLQEINDYCRCDVLDTYFVFLRAMAMTGRLTLDQEQAVVEKAKHWLEQQSVDQPVYQDYLQSWGTWSNPWTEEQTPDPA